MLLVNNKYDCCGCGACEQICSKKCIILQEDEEGFCYPVIDKKRCIECRRCLTVCPIKRTGIEVKTKEKIHNAYAAYSLNSSIRRESSSGGIFSLIAEKILDEGGIVFGAAFDEDKMVRHIAISQKDDLYKLRGSKYLQSRIGNTYRMAKLYLEDRKKVLFSGTACQIAGLKSYLGRDYNDLFTIDILCHGVPSPKVWRKYLQYHEKKQNAAVTSINFRNKECGWKKYSINILFSSHKVYKCKHSEDDYMRLFLSDLCLRPSCYACKFKTLDRPSDLTLGDCWGIEKTFPQMDDDNGISVVITHTQKGKKIFDSLTPKMKRIQAEVDELLPPTADSRKSVKEPAKRLEFFTKLNKGEEINHLIKLTQPSMITRAKKKLKYYGKHLFGKRIFNICKES